MTSHEVLKAVFLFLDGQDLGSCIGVCRQWREVAGDDYFWKCLCSKYWPSVCNRTSLPTVSYKKIFQTFYSYRYQNRRPLLPPRISFDDLEFYIDVWNNNILIFSKVVSGRLLRTGIRNPPPGIAKMHILEGPECKMIIQIDPRFTIPAGETPSVSVLVGRKDSDKIACIISKSLFDYIDLTSYRALAFNYLQLSPLYPFVSGVRAWIALLFMEERPFGEMDVFGIQIDFCDVATSEEEVLWLLDMLDWR